MLVAARQVHAALLRATHLNRQAVRVGINNLGLFLVVDLDPLDELVQHQQREVIGHAVDQDQALLFAVLRHKADTKFDGVCRLADLRDLAVDEDLSALNRVNAEQRPCHFRTARANEAGESQNLAFFERKAHVVEITVAHVAELQHRFLTVEAILNVHLLDLAADHHGDDVLIRGARDRVGADIVSIAQNGVAVADGHDLLETVRNINNSDPTLFYFQNLLEQNVHFLFGQRGRRFIHNNDLCVERQCSGDLKHLLLGNGKSADFLLRPQIQPKRIEQLLCLFQHLLFVQKRELILCNFFSQINIFGHRHGVDHQDFLMHEADTMTLGDFRAGDVNLFTVQNDRSGVCLVCAVEDLHQGRFAGAVFTQQGMDLTALYLQFYIVENLHTKKGEVYTLHFQHILVIFLHALSPNSLISLQLT